MMLRQFLIIVFFSVAMHANANGLSSKVQSSLEGVELPNAHHVGSSGQIFRSMQPMEHMHELELMEIEEVLIFKHQTSDEVDREKELLKEIGIKRIHHIPFPWKNFSSLQEGCEQLIAGLRIIKRAQARGRNILFHCTVGEDRTGALAGLWRMLEGETDVHAVFQTEMCQRGYANGNPLKPSNVTKAIEKELTPLFFAMAAKIKKGELQVQDLDLNVCNSLRPVAKLRRCP
jgi:hypothetical protein